MLEFTGSLLDQYSAGRIYWARNFAAPYGLAYDEESFARFTDKVWRWIRKVGRKLPEDPARSPYFLPDAWSRYSKTYYAEKERALAELVARNRNYVIKVIRARVVKGEG